MRARSLLALYISSSTVALGFCGVGAQSSLCPPHPSPSLHFVPDFSSSEPTALILSPSHALSHLNLHMSRLPASRTQKDPLWFCSTGHSSGVCLHRPTCRHNPETIVTDMPLCTPPAHSRARFLSHSPEEQSVCTCGAVSPCGAGGREHWWIPWPGTAGLFCKQYNVDSLHPAGLYCISLSLPCSGAPSPRQWSALA
jgi:hypothetical protein